MHGKRPKEPQRKEKQASPTIPDRYRFDPFLNDFLLTHRQILNTYVYSHARGPACSHTTLAQSPVLVQCTASESGIHQLRGVPVIILPRARTDTGRKESHNCRSKPRIEDLWRVSLALIGIGLM